MLRENMVDHEFEKLPNGNMVGYRVSRYVHGFAVSGADSRQRHKIDVGTVVSFDGKGAFLTNKAEYATSMYAVHDVNVLIKCEFDADDVTSGNIYDEEPEISVKKFRILDTRIFEDDD
jgi:hypothetical protein